MKGFVKNKKSDWAYAMKRSIRPGGEVSLDELYTQYGEKHSIEAGEPFVEWLRNVKLKNKDYWEIVYDFGEVADLSTSVENIPAVLDMVGVEDDGDIPTHKSAIKSLSVEDIAALSVRKARAMLPKVMDLKLLQYALSEAKQLQDKDSLCRLLERRIKELQIAR
jgi:hypothetical protein